MPWLWWKTTGLLHGRSGLIPGQSMWDLWWRVWHWDYLFRFSSVIVAPPVLQTQSFICQQSYIILAVDSVIK